MKTERLTMAALITTSAFVGSGCDRLLGPDVASGDRIYFNSFESPRDVVGWWGIGEMQLKNEAPPSGGQKSVFISGGVIFLMLISNSMGLTKTAIFCSAAGAGIWRSAETWRCKWQTICPKRFALEWPTPLGSFTSLRIRCIGRPTKG